MALQTDFSLKDVPCLNWNEVELPLEQVGNFFCVYPEYPQGQNPTIVKTLWGLIYSPSLTMDYIYRIENSSLIKSC